MREVSKLTLVLGDPVFSATDQRLSVAKGSSLADGNSSLIDAQRSAAQSELAELVRLRFSRQEGDWLQD